MPYTLPPLPYDYAALEPHIDAQTMRIHHDKHHRGYVDNLNAALDKHPEWHMKGLEELLIDIAHELLEAFHMPLRVLVQRDRKSTRLNSSHVANSYAVFCLKKK